jgi:hypothetical protein
MRKLPSGIDPPIITKADPDADPVFSMVVAGGGACGKSPKSPTRSSSLLLKRSMAWRRSTQRGRPANSRLCRCRQAGSV